MLTSQNGAAPLPTSPLGHRILLSAPRRGAEACTEGYRTSIHNCWRLSLPKWEENRHRSYSCSRPGLSRRRRDLTVTAGTRTGRNSLTNAEKNKFQREILPQTAMVIDEYKRQNGKQRRDYAKSGYPSI